MRITVEVVPYGQGGDGPYRAGMAVVRLDGDVIAKLRTCESIGFDVSVGVATFKPELLYHEDAGCVTNRTELDLDSVRPGL